MCLILAWYCGIEMFWYCGKYLPGIVVLWQILAWYSGIVVNTCLVFQSVTIYCFWQLSIQPQLAPLVPAIKAKDIMVHWDGKAGGVHQIHHHHHHHHY